MNLVIVAGGLGSRLAPLTNHIPKFLVNIGKETGFVEQIRYWREYSPETITVIVHSDYKEMVQAYYDLYFKGDEKLKVIDGAGELTSTPFYVKTVDEAKGSANAIMASCYHLEHQPVLFTWCDVIPGEHFDVEQLIAADCVAFTNYDYPNRYDLVGESWAERVPEIRPDGRGGLFGIYYVGCYRPVVYTNGQDFVELLPSYSRSGYVSELRMNNIIDFGDKPKLERTRATADHARSFNSVTIQGDLVLKAALNQQGASLIEREVLWYEELDRSGNEVMRPKHWARKTTEGELPSFIMSRVKGMPIWQLWPTLDAEGRAMVLTRLFEQLNFLHSHKKAVGSDVVLRDVKMEAYTKLMSRYTEIEPLVKSFGPITTVNGKRLTSSDPRKVISELYEELAWQYVDTTEHSMIHGDLQMSNSMIDPDTLEITLIDPRGYFGSSITYGAAEYDVAKLLYSLSGYDLFNYSHTFHIDLPQSGHICFDIPRPDTEGTEAIMSAKFNRTHELWLAVIWIGLAQYIKNDPVKSIAAHYHGLQLAEAVLGY